MWSIVLPTEEQVLPIRSHLQLASHSHSQSGRSAPRSGACTDSHRFRIRLRINQGKGSAVRAGSAESFFGRSCSISVVLWLWLISAPPCVNRRPTPNTLLTCPIHYACNNCGYRIDWDSNGLQMVPGTLNGSRNLTSKNQMLLRMWDSEVNAAVARARIACSFARRDRMNARRDRMNERRDRKNEPVGR